MTHKELLQLLVHNNIPFVVVGGTALRLYNSPRITHDIDLSVRAVDIDAVVELMYSHGYFLVTKVEESLCELSLNPAEALAWIEREKAGSASFIRTGFSPENHKVEHRFVDAETQVDFLFELSIPFPRLRQNARTVTLKDLSFPVASPEDLLYLKRNRKEPDEADREDIRFLENLDT